MVLVCSGRSLVVEMILWIEYAGNFLACSATFSFYKVILPRRVIYLAYVLGYFESVLYISSKLKRSVDMVAYLQIVPLVSYFSVFSS
jgi:hypothetical protein